VRKLIGELVPPSATDWRVGGRPQQVILIGVSDDRPALLTRGLRLEYVTLGWNVIGVAVIAVAALGARSVALAGFGLDSLIEIFASVVVVWELTGSADVDRERKAVRWIGGAFFVLALYITAQAVFVLVVRAHPHRSGLGIAWTGLTFIVMLALAGGKAATGKALGNAVLQTEGKVTLVDAYLAATVLVGLGLRAEFGWWWADPLAGFVVVFYGIKEGVAAFSE
jgi:divalent metal cation (Fe/Co/Zn/Cd) transporter